MRVEGPGALRSGSVTVAEGMLGLQLNDRWQEWFGHVPCLVPGTDRVVLLFVLPQCLMGVAIPGNPCRKHQACYQGRHCTRQMCIANVVKPSSCGLTQE